MAISCFLDVLKFEMMGFQMAENIYKFIQASDQMNRFTQVHQYMYRVPNSIFLRTIIMALVILVKVWNHW